MNSKVGAKVQHCIGLPDLLQVGVVSSKAVVLAERENSSRIGPSYCCPDKNIAELFAVN